MRGSVGTAVNLMVEREFEAVGNLAGGDRFSSEDLRRILGDVVGKVRLPSNSDYDSLELTEGADSAGPYFDCKLVLSLPDGTDACDLAWRVREFQQLAVFDVELLHIDVRLTPDELASAADLRPWVVDHPRAIDPEWADVSDVTPITLPGDASEPEIVAAVESWVSLLEAGEFARALAMTPPTADDWSPGLLRALVTYYGLPYPNAYNDTYRVTPIAQAVGTPRIELERFDAPVAREHGSVIGELWYNLPLNGEWSDLTAAFDLVVSGERLALRLDQVHVF